MIAVLFVLFGFAAAAFGQYNLTATVDRTVVAPGESVSLTLTFSGAASGISDPVFSGFENLQLVAGPYTSTNISIVNGRSSMSASYTYRLRAGQAGTGRIGSVKVRYKDQEYASGETVIRIGTTVASAPVGGGGGSEDVFVRVFADKTEAFLGEQITLTYKIFFAVQITSPEIMKLPRMAGFWVEDYKMPAQLALADEVVNGRAYKSAVFRKVGLFPTSTGELEIEPLVIATKIEQRSRRQSRDPFDIFNDPFFQLGRQLAPVEISAPGIKLQIKPLPEAGRPANFSGAVGSFKIMSAVDRTECLTGDGITFTVTLDGMGSIKTLPPPEIAFPPDVQRYDPEVTDNIQRNQRRIGGRKIFSYVIIPRAPGLLTLPEISYSFFDPERSGYATATTPKLTVEVKKGEGSAAMPSNITVASKQGVTSIATDIAFVKSHPGRRIASADLPHQRPAFWIWAILPWLGAVSTLALERRWERRRDARTDRRRMAKLALREIAHAEKAARANRTDEVIRRIAGVLDGFVDAVVTLTGARPTADELRPHWEAGGFSPELLPRILDAQAECDRIRFAGGKPTTEQARRLIGTTAEIVRDFARPPHAKGSAR